MGVVGGVISTVAHVGSCSTLVGEILVADDKYDLGSDLGTLLLSAILLDTGNLLTEHLVTDKDKAMAEELLKLLPKDFNTKSHFLTLSKARRDISNLSILQVLRRDFKQSMVMEKFCIGFSTITAELGPFVSRDNFSLEVFKFFKDSSLDVLLLLGAYLADGDHDNWKRQIAVCRPEGCVSDLADSIASMLEGNDELRCSRVEEGGFEGVLMNQDNNKLSRKYILPIVTQFVTDV